MDTTDRDVNNLQSRIATLEEENLHLQEVHIDDLRILESLEVINRIIIKATDPDKMLDQALAQFLDFFACDRAWLLYPCDPNSGTFRVPIERTRPQWPGAHTSDKDVPHTDFSRGVMELAINASGAVRFDAEENTLDPGESVSVQFHICSQLVMMIRPRSGKPWLLGIHHCEAPVIYNQNDRHLFETLGARLGDGISNLLSWQESKSLFENAEIPIWNEDLSDVRRELDRLRLGGLVDIRKYLEEDRQRASDFAAMVKVVQVNGATLKLFGAKNNTDFIDQIDRMYGDNAIDVFIDELCAIWEGKPVFRSDVTFHALDGRDIDAILTFNIPQTSDGFRSIPVSIIDITERKEMERKLEQQYKTESLLNQAIDAYSDSVILYDQNEKIIFSNSQYHRNYPNSPPKDKILGCTQEFLLRGSLEAGLIDVPLAKSDPEAWIKKRLTERREAKDEIGETVHTNGRTYLYRHMRTTDGCVMIVQTDITERKQAEATIQEAREEAEESNKAKSEFLASMSHELRTPLNAVLGFAQMLKYDPHKSLTPSQDVHVECIIEGGNHLLALVNDILDLSKIEADQIDISLDEVNANDVVKECVTLIELLGDAREIKIVDAFSSEDTIHLRTDQIRFKQGLINLLSNAIKFNKHGGTVSIEGHATDDGFLRISITDTGIGIPKKDQDKIFRIFHRIITDPMVAREGTGIGLTVTKHLIERLAGRIGFESEGGVGSTFWIELPLASNKRVLIWSDSLRVGVDALDKDHQVVIGLLNKLTFRSIEGVGLNKAIDELIDYTRYHFRREEEIMKVCGYPDTKKHRILHQALTTKVHKFSKNRNKADSQEALGNLQEFLRQWWIGHIVNVDTGIAQYAKDRDHEISNALESLKLPIEHN